MRTRFASLAALIRDDPERAKAELREGMRLWPRTGFLVQHWYEMFGTAETFLYCGDPCAAYRYLAERWRSLAWSLLTRVQAVRIHSLNLRAWCAVAASGEGARPPRPELIRQALRDARRIERERMPWGDALSRLIRAGIAAARGEIPSAIGHLETAETKLASVGMALTRNVARRRRGELLGGREGDHLASTADGWMKDQGIADPRRFAGMLAPGFSLDPAAARALRDSEPPALLSS